jgi:hypothetical protein
MVKKAWKKPELIVLVRGRPEEAVLAACKTGTEGGPQGQHECKHGNDVCSSWTGS